MSNDLLYGDLTYRVRAAVFKVYNTLGFGHKEQVYHKALTIEFRKQKLEFEEERALDVKYEDQKVGTYKPDFVIEGKIIVEIKALPFMGKDSEVQMIYYLKGTNFKLGLLVNFGSNELDIKRKVWSGYPRQSAIDQRQST